jgi:hypothetical protein
MLCKIWDFHGGDYEECRLLGYKNPVCPSQETHYVSATEPSRLMLCKIWGFQGGNYEECLLLWRYVLWLLLRTDVLVELIACIIRVKRIGELRTTLAVTSNRGNLRKNFSSSETSAITSAICRHVPEDGILLAPSGHGVSISSLKARVTITITRFTAGASWPDRSDISGSIWSIIIAPVTKFESSFPLISLHVLPDIVREFGSVLLRSRGQVAVAQSV